MRPVIEDPFRIVNAVQGDQAHARTFQAIVSPCSECQNYRATPGEGQTLCPRRLWQERVKEAEDAPFSYLALTGWEDQAASPSPDTPARQDADSGSRSEDTIRNPVFSATEQTVLVWIATLDDNQGVYAKDGTPLTPDLLYPGFDTRYIRCRVLPVSPVESQDQFYQQGRLKEWDQLLVLEFRNHQNDGGNPVAPSASYIGGAAWRMNFHRSFPLQAPQRDLLVSGT